MLQLVSWSLTSLFSTNMAISETKGHGWRERKPAIYNLNPGCSSHP